MFHKKVAQYPLWAWILAALSAPVARLAGRGPWLGVLVIALACGGLCWGIHACTEETPAMGRWYCAAEFLFLLFAVGEIARSTASCWPTGDGFPTVPLTLLILAAFSAWDGADRASRIGGVLVWLLALLYALVLGAGAKDLHAAWLLPETELPSPLLIPVFLLPAVAAFLPREKGNVSLAALLTLCGFAGIVALWTAGTLSGPVARAVNDPFYEFSKSLNLFGVAERFEAFVSVALTLGYFSLLSLLLSAAGYLAERFHDGWGKPGIVICALAGAGILALRPAIPELLLAAMSLLFWGVLPFLAACLGKIKISKIGGKKS